MRIQQRPISGVMPERIASLAALVEAMKQNQVRQPRAQFAVAVGGEQFRIALLPSGYLELEGKVQSVSIEKEFDQAIASVGATLYVQ